MTSQFRGKRDGLIGVKVKKKKEKKMGLGSFNQL